MAAGMILPTSLKTCTRSGNHSLLVYLVQSPFSCDPQAMPVSSRLCVMGAAGRSLMDIQKDEEARAAARAAAQPAPSDVKSPGPSRAGHWGAATGPAVKPGHAPFLLHSLSSCCEMSVMHFVFTLMRSISVEMLREAITSDICCTFCHKVRVELAWLHPSQLMARYLLLPLSSYKRIVAVSLLSY